ncbi:MAG: hypothetical protein HKN39_03800 [Flavobacteriales bacterium]|nr:hypothetical protein [Flavobacteriales bacterium]
MKFLFIIITLLSLNLDKVHAQSTSVKYVSIDLLNRSANSIPLVIEGVMKPNLSPFSRSGVSCKVGTRIWAKERKELLFVVSEEMDGTEIIVNKRLSELERNKKGDQ